MGDCVCPHEVCSIHGDNTRKSRISPTMMAEPMCKDPTHTEPFACHRLAEGGFVCESTLLLEQLLYAVPGNGASATFRWNEGRFEQLIDVGDVGDDEETQGPAWQVLLEYPTTKEMKDV